MCTPVDGLEDLDPLGDSYRCVPNEGGEVNLQAVSVS